MNHAMAGKLTYIGMIISKWRKMRRRLLPLAVEKKVQEPYLLSH